MNTETPKNKLACEFRFVFAIFALFFLLSALGGTLFAVIGLAMTAFVSLTGKCFALTMLSPLCKNGLKNTIEGVKQDFKETAQEVSDGAKELKDDVVEEAKEVAKEVKEAVKTKDT